MSQEASGSTRFSFATGSNINYVEQLYATFKQDPASVDESWRKFFEGYEFAALGDPLASGSAPGAGSSEDKDIAKVEAFINAYRRLGHLSAHLNPLAPPPGIAADMTAQAHGLGQVNPKQVFHPANLPPPKTATFAEIQALLTQTYCGRIGADFREINDIGVVTWFQDQMEGCRNKPPVSPDVKRRILTTLTKAEGFEQFLGRRYIGVKRFSLEGNDTLIPLLDLMAAEAAKSGVEEMCIGMAHRGRLSVLTNFMGKSYEQLLKEFEGSEYNVHDIDGDVKYHMGFASEIGTMYGDRIRLYLSPNPSHLEVVNPVVEGFVRARQRLIGDQDRSRVLPILMHGDAAFVGQGTCSETLNLSQLAAYTTGGTVHLIINNQVGFTTDPDESRSTVYSSDIAKMVRAPVLHVNADDPEAVIWCGHLALAYRQKFGADVVIDLVGYRRHGHNEGDEPAFTQPVMYKKIAAHPTVLTQYAETLVKAKDVTADAIKKEADDFRDVMQAAYDAVHGKKSPQVPAAVIPVALQKSMTYKKASRDDVALAVKTGVDLKGLRALAARLTVVPQGFTLNPKLARLLESRQKMLDGKGKVDWGFGELLALASLAKEGHHVRLTGQDAQRGTFTSRHAVFTDFETNQRFEPLNNLGGEQGAVHVINSPLSEQGCLGFEFGYSVADPDALVAWEAQFGDFANGAQIIIDQFLSASEAKWRQTSGLVMLLPHGYEGQGPEHSSARPERFLQLCGNLNLQVAYPTTPAQHFHLLRRQLHRDFRKPLVVMTPKSLLREPLCTSGAEAFESDYFHEVLDDTLNAKQKASVERAIFCSGKIYYDLIKQRTENPAFSDVAIIRLEQPYPFPYARMEELILGYPRLSELIWTQEEPQNMGGWNFVRGRLLEVLSVSQKLTYVGRKNSGTPAEGSGKAHEAEQKRILQDALGRAAGIVKAGTAATGK